MPKTTVIPPVNILNFVIWKTLTIESSFTQWQVLMRILLIYSLWGLHLSLKLLWKRLYGQKVSGRERTGRKADWHKDSAGIHLVTTLEMSRRIVLMYLLDLSQILMKTSRGWDCFNIYQVHKRSLASALCFTLVRNSTQGISTILPTKQIPFSPSCTRQVALLHIEMLHNSLGRKWGGEEQKKITFRTLRIFRESKSYSQPCNLIYKSEMHIWLIFFYYIAFISGSLFTFVPFWSAKKPKHFWH